MPFYDFLPQEKIDALLDHLVVRPSVFICLCVYQDHFSLLNRSSYQVKVIMNYKSTIPWSTQKLSQCDLQINIFCDKNKKIPQEDLHHDLSYTYTHRRLPDDILFLNG